MGERRIGVALSDEMGLLAFPLTTIFHSDMAGDVSAVLRIAQERDAKEIVVGLPLSLDGRRGPQALSVEKFVAALEKRTSIPIKTWDERFSTQDAQRLLQQVGVKPSREKGRLDAASAAVILQAYLDSQRRSHS